VYRSTNGGHDWMAVFGSRVCEAMAVSPGFSTDHTLWASMASYSASLGLYVSNDGGDHWALLAPSVRGQVIAPSPNYAVDQTLFVGASDSGVFKSGDRGAHWTLVLTQL